MTDHLGLGAFEWCTGIEDTFVGQQAPGKRRLDEYELQQHYEHWREDIDLAADVGFGMIRYGIPWYLVEPERGRFDWSFTDQVIPYISERGMRPIIDLVHYGTPLWLQSEFLHPAYPDRVAAYAVAFAERYEWVRHYTPLNEPFINAELCGRTGRWPPAFEGDGGFARLIDALCRGIAQTVVVLKEARPDAVMIHVEATGIGSTDEPALSERLALDMHRERVALDLITGRVDGGHPLEPYLLEHGVSRAHLAWFREHAVELDVLGLNYYPFMSVWRRVLDMNGGTRHEAIWGGSEHLERLVRDYHDRYRVPIFITECSHNERAQPGSIFGAPPYAAGPPGRARTAWLDEAVAAVDRLLRDGIPVVGFTWWPLYDLVNWEYREGTGPVEEYLEPMGLYALRPDDGGDLRREPLECVDRMRRVIEARKEVGTPGARGVGASP
jgi:beta-glucosidase